MHFKQIHTKKKTVEWHENQKLTERVLKNQSWPLYPQLQLQSVLLFECHGLFSLFFQRTCPLRGGRIVWVHGRGHYLPTCFSIRATTIQPTLAALREHRGLKPVGLTGSYQHTQVKKRDQELLNGSLWLRCVQGKCVALSGPCQNHGGAEMFFRHYKMCWWLRGNSSRQVMPLSYTSTFATVQYVTSLSVTDVTSIITLHLICEKIRKEKI